MVSLQVLQVIFYFFLTAIAIQTLKWCVEIISISTADKIGKKKVQEGVSIIVCAKNEAKRLPEILESLLEQDYPTKEIIVVDDRSTDGTYDLLLSYGDKVKHVRIDQTPDHMNNKKYAISLGIKAASNEKLLFTDADCLPNNEKWVSTMMRYHTKGIVLGFSQYLKKPDLLNKFIRFETLLSAIQYLSMARLGRAYMGVGRNMGYNKSIFIDNKGFYGYNDVMGGDDDLFVNKHSKHKNTSVAITTQALFYSHPKETLRAFFRQKKRHIAVSKHYKSLDKIILGSFSMAQISYWTCLIALLWLQYEPEILLGIHFIRTLILTINMYLASLRLGDRINLILIPLFDLFYTFYLLTVGSIAMIAKKITWN